MSIYLNGPDFQYHSIKTEIFDNFSLKGVPDMVKGQRFELELIVTLLCQIDVLTTNGKTLAQTAKLLQNQLMLLQKFAKEKLSLVVDLN